MRSVLNKFIALFGLLVLLPVFILTSIGIILSDGFPVFFKTKRVGKNLKLFFIYKFRSMYYYSEGSMITMKNDKRIFLFGKFIRYTKIDEIPQLINILMGDMNIIGPRPEDPHIVDNYYDDIMMKTLKIKPGLSSPGTIYYYTDIENKLVGNDHEKKYLKLLPLKLRIDLIYIRNRNMFYDLKLIFDTIYVILKKIIGLNNFPKRKEIEKAKLI